MKLSNALMVHQMMSAYRQHIPTVPVPMDGDTAELRKRLITEEYQEVMDAINNNEPLRDLAKELCDLLVVTYGTLLAMGVNPDYAFTLVHNSNMTKLGDDGRPVKNEFGKVIKSANYKPADMNQIYGATTCGLSYYNVSPPMRSVILNLPLDIIYNVRKKDSKVQKFILNLNNYRNTHHRILHQAKALYEELVISLLPSDAKELLYGKQVVLSFRYFPATQRLVDVSNPIAIIEKFATDALVKAGVLEDDNYKVVVRSDGWRYGGVDKDNPRCEMTITVVE